MQTIPSWLSDLVRGSSTPHFVYDLHVVRQQIDRFRHLFPGVDLFYSTKTCSVPALLDTCLDRGMQFDVATIPEIELLLRRGAQPAALLYTHPVKTVAEIQRAYQLGVRRFTCDSIVELTKLATHAPGSELFIRLSPTHRNASLYNYRQRLGAPVKDATEILRYAVSHRILVHGISFHVGSQSMKAEPWAKALRQVRELTNKFGDQIPTLRQINIGSGFPVEYDFGNNLTLEAVAKAARKEMAKFPADFTFMAEPGRIIAAPAAVFVISIVENLSRGKTNWLFTDTSVYNGLIERLESGGTFRYPITSSVTTEPLRSYSLAGKTLDPDDIISTHVSLSSALKAGDLLFVHNAGAYSVEFATEYHQLPRPLVTIYDSQYAEGVQVGSDSRTQGGVRATRAFDKDEVLFEITGHRSNERTRTTLQINADTHMEPNLFGAYLNHSCAPNAGTRTNADGTLNIVARRPIGPDEEVTVDYAMFEYELGPMASVVCLCGSGECRGTILGYKHLSPTKKAEYQSYIADYLLS